MRIEAHGTTHRGLLRANNEDAYLCGPTVFAVADGLGGLPAGEVASALAVRTLEGLSGRTFADPGQAQQALVTAVEEANQAVLIDGRARPAHVGMATTLTAALPHEGRLLLAHVGDSRAYLLRGRLRQLTTDHTPAGEALAAGNLSPDEAEHHPERHILTRVIGEHGVQVDRPDPVDLAPGDRLLLCSDGLNEAVPADEIVRLLAEADDPAAACDRLVEATLAAGAPDNVTVVVLFALENAGDQRS